MVACEPEKILGILGEDLRDSRKWDGVSRGDLPRFLMGELSVDCRGQERGVIPVYPGKIRMVQAAVNNIRDAF